MKEGHLTRALKTAGRQTGVQVGAFLLLCTLIIGCAAARDISDLKTASIVLEYPPISLGLKTQNRFHNFKIWSEDRSNTKSLGLEAVYLEHALNPHLFFSMLTAMARACFNLVLSSLDLPSVILISSFLSSPNALRSSSHAFTGFSRFNARSFTE